MTYVLVFVFSVSGMDIDWKRQEFEFATLTECNEAMRTFQIADDVTGFVLCEQRRADPA